MKVLLIPVVLALSLAVVGCKKSEADTPASADEKHAAEGAKPGSHEDWCGEHGVPESQCTRCHPELAAAFQATGDWCAEHGVPKSHDTRCNPNLKITRPPKGS
jgi:hypothetical protein